MWGVSPSPACVELVHMDAGELVGKGEVLQTLQSTQRTSYVPKVLSISSLCVLCVDWVRTTKLLFLFN